jgi:hypothetical protein
MDAAGRTLFAETGLTAIFVPTNVLVCVETCKIKEWIIISVSKNKGK